MKPAAAEKWDVHTHTVLSPATYASLEKYSRYSDFIRVRAHESKPCCAVLVSAQGQVRREIENNAYDGGERLKDCDAHGVTLQVLSPTPMMIPDYVDNAKDAHDICKILNDDNAALVRDFPGRFAALGAVPLHHAEAAIAELERIKNDLGMRGIEINSNINGRDLDDPAFFPVFQAAQDMGMAVFIHPWGGFMSPGEEKLKKRMNASRNWRPWLIGMAMETALAFDSMRCGGVHERLPRLRVLYAHGGGAFPALLGRLEHGAYCRPDLFKEASQLNPCDTIKSCGVYTDTLTHDARVLRMLVEMFGAERLAMGSDYPYPLGEVDPFDPVSMKDPRDNACPYPKTKGIYPGHMIENMEGLTIAQKQRMLSGTAKEWLGVP